MSFHLSLDDRDIDVNVSSIVLCLSDDEFQGNIDFTLLLSEPVPSGKLLSCLRLRIHSDEHRHAETLEVQSYQEMENGYQISMYWAAISQNATEPPMEIPKEVELVWENDTGQSIGWFPLKAAGLPDTPAAPSPSLGSASREGRGDDDPKGLFTEELPRRKTISMKWFDRDTPFTLVSGILFTAGPLAMGWYSGHRAMEIGSMAFSLVGVSIFYFGICKLFNKTCIVIENSQLNVTFRPLPWPNRFRPIPVDSIRGVSTRKRKHRHKENTGTTTRTRTSYSYVVEVSTQTQGRVKVVSHDSSETALFIKNKLEQFLES